MKLPASLLDPKTGKVIGICSCAGYAICALIGIAWAGRVAYLVPKSKALEASIKVAKSNLLQTNHDLTDVKSEPSAQPMPKGFDVVQKIQSDVVLAAEGAHCTLIQFSAPSLSTAFAAHYGTAADGYRAYHIRVSLAGTLSGIMSMLGTLSDDDVPIEFTSLGFSPSGTGATNGQKGVLAQVEFDALSKAEAS